MNPDPSNLTTWQNISCPALLMIAVVLLYRAMRDIRSGLDALKDAINRLPPPAQTPYVPPRNSPPLP